MNASSRHCSHQNLDPASRLFSSPALGLPLRHRRPRPTVHHRHVLRSSAAPVVNQPLQQQAAGSAQYGGRAATAAGRPPFPSRGDVYIHGFVPFGVNPICILTDCCILNEAPPFLELFIGKWLCDFQLLQTLCNEKQALLVEEGIAAMGSKTLIRWSKNITPSQVVQLIRAERDIQKAILIFDSATAEYANGFKHDCSTFGIMISRLAAANKFRLAEQLMNRMKEEKCCFSEDIFLSMCKAYGRAHKPLDALRIFHKAKAFQHEPTQKLYVTVFSILVDENQLILAHRFHDYMKEMDVPTCVASFNVLIKAFCKSTETLDAAFRVFREMSEHGCIPDTYTYGTLINGLCKLGKVSKAKELFRDMRKKGCIPTVVTYSTLIHGLCQSNNLNEAMDLLMEMGHDGIEPNIITYSSLMDGLCKGGQSSQALELLEQMVNKHHSPNMITYSTLISGLCKEEKLREALEVMDRMKIQGYKPDVGLYSKLINGLCDSHKFTEAANFLDEMILSGISPNRVTRSVHVKIHNRVVQGLCCENLLDRAFQIYLGMRSRGISSDRETFNILVDYLCKKGDVHKAARVVIEMESEGCIPDEVTWTTIIHGFWGRRKVREAAELVQAELLRGFLGSNNIV